MEKSNKESQEKQRRWNPETLKLLQENGSDLTKLHKIVNVFHLFDKSEINKITTILEESGYQVVKVMEMSNSNEIRFWSLDACVEIVPELGRINSMTDWCVEVASKVIATNYDGWYTQPEF